MNADVSSFFGCMVFNDRIMRQRLPEDIYASLQRTKREGTRLEPHVAEAVASAMKDWAIENGATHYTHWFQPMNNITAGKHDSFITPVKDGEIVQEFSGKALIQGEPDASSFPSGGLRATFEARGYTAWDPTSPAFIRGKTLYIPTAFWSYTGEALDTKTPLLRSMEAVSNQALRILRAFGNTTSKRVIATIGAEQEYFLVDREAYEKRLDLKICGRTLFGAPPVKGQQLDDHYCGRIRLRVEEFMNTLDEELWKLGVTAKTKHNETAPAQHELAPVYASANIACDHNQLTMEMMRIVAKRQGLACLLHEKPFAYVNGSGKHNNWSLSTDDGINLFNPSNNPHKNYQFLIFLCATIEAVDRHADLLRFSCASAGNDHRLGACEAPPAIISIYLGDRLTNILQSIADGHHLNRSTEEVLEMGVQTLPQLLKDDSDRNRTSPFAFTGNKFEFRMLGSSASIANANVVLNTIVAEVLDEYANILEQSDDLKTAIKHIVADTMKNHSRIIFNGNNYSDEWVTEAQRRGLPILNSTVESADRIIDAKNIALFEKYHIFSENECHARHEIMLENYVNLLSIEVSVMLEMIRRQILPACIRFVGDTANHYNQLLQSGFDNSAIKQQLGDLNAKINAIQEHTDRLNQLWKAAKSIECLHSRAQHYRDVIIPAMQKLRACSDAIEPMVCASYWPMPTYVDLLHRV